MTVEIEKEQPVIDAEHAAEKVAPAALQPEAAVIAAELNAAVDSAAEKAPEAEKEAAKVDPALDKVARDAAAVAAGGKLDSTLLVGDSVAAVKEVRRGYKTTEFWIAAVTIVLAQVGALHLPGKYGDTIATIGAAGSYILSRGLAK